MLITGKVVTTFGSCNGFRDFLSLYSLRSQYLYSSRSTPAAQTHFLVKYLVDSLGFSNDEATSTSSKVTARKTFKDPDLVLKFLIKNGFDKTQMKIMVSRAPKLLLCDVSKTLKPKFQFLMDIGLSGSDLVDVFVRGTKLVERGLNTHLRPTIDFLRRILGSDEDVLKLIKRSPWLLSSGAFNIIKDNVLLLRNYGFSDVHIRTYLLRNHRPIQKPEWIKDLVYRVENDFRIPCDSPSFLYAFQVLNSHKESTLEKKFGIFKSFGWSDDDVLNMFRKLPYCIGLSEVRIRKALNLFMKELGFESAYLASHPAILMYSLEKRVLPRMQVLKILDEKKLERRMWSLYTVLSLTETKFIKYFVLPYKDQIPDLYESLNKTLAP